jgi:signal transduction histidine kinase
VKVLLVDDNRLVRTGIRQLLELAQGFEVVGEGSNGIEAVEAVERLRPDVVVMDMNMPVMNGVEATRLIKQRFPGVKVLALTAFADMKLVTGMLRAGASGYLLKGGSSEELVESLRAVAGGGGALDREVAGAVIEDAAELYRREQERADALAELDRMKSEFIGVVSHELYTPLTAIKGGVVTLRRSWRELSEEVRDELLDTIGRQCDHLGRLINKILLVSGIQRGGLGVTQDEFELADLVTDALAPLRERAAGRLETDLGDVRASGDRALLTDVLGSLVDNALRHTEGRVRVSCRARGGWACIAVADDGPGMTPELVRQMLAEPFHQADSSSTRRAGGLGLSLYLARRVLEASGGTLDVDSAPGRGSTFTMKMLPAG